MKLLTDRKTIINSLLIGLYITVQGIFLQVSKGIILLEKNPDRKPSEKNSQLLSYLLSGICCSRGILRTSIRIYNYSNNPFSDCACSFDHCGNWNYGSASGA